MIELELPFPPTINHYKNIGRLKITKSGKIYQARYNSPDTMQFYCDVINECRHQGIKSFDRKAILSVEIDLYPPDKRKRDIDNSCKVLLDALQKANVYEDDTQIARLVIQRKEIKKEGKVLVRIFEI
jgi:crossover junction endodeoxyribonuclease RusA